MTRTALTSGGLEKKTIESRQGVLTWFEGGSGPPIVLLHGTNDQAGSWAAVAKALAPSWKVVVPDLPGHGESDPRDGPITCARLAEGVEAVIAAALPEGTFILAGNSMGGWLAMLYALEHPDRVAGLVLEDAGGLFVPPAERPNLIPATRDEARAIMTKVQGPVAALIPDPLLDDLVATSKTSPLTRLDMKSLEACLLDGRLGKVAVPAVVLWGSIDGVLPPDYGRKLAAAISESTFVLLDGCGHIPHLHCAGNLVPRLLESLETLEQRGDQPKRPRPGGRAAR